MGSRKTSNLRICWQNTPQSTVPVPCKAKYGLRSLFKGFAISNLAQVVLTLPQTVITFPDYQANKCDM
jgi:hypothetical protein